MITTQEEEEEEEEMIISTVESMSPGEILDS